MTPATRNAIAQQCAYISSDASIAANIQALHDRDITPAHVARIRRGLPAKAYTYGGRRSATPSVAGPTFGAGDREVNQRAALNDSNRRYVDRMIEKGQVASWPALAAWAERHGDADLAKAALRRAGA